MILDELEDVLLNHSRMYPLMETQDLIKLIYQLSLGPKHLFNIDLEKNKETLFLEASKNNSQDKEIVYIGNDLYRVTLVNDKEFLSNLYACFVKTCNDYSEVNNESDFRDNIEESLKYLSLFSCINKDEYVTFVNKYFKDGLKPISHSDNYKKAYHPSYRLIHKKYIKGV